jgi:hypothetical protein
MEGRPGERSMTVGASSAINGFSYFPRRQWGEQWGGRNGRAGFGVIKTWVARSLGLGAWRLDCSASRRRVAGRGRAGRSAASRALTSGRCRVGAGRLGRPGAGSRAGAPWRLAREREKRGEREGEIRGERERAQGAAATVGARRRQGRALGVNGPLVGLRVRGFFFFSK